jgi:NADH-quinone oxidoreductase subunit F
VRTRLHSAADLEQLCRRVVAEQEGTTQRVRVCLGTGCTANGAGKVFEQFRREAEHSGEESLVVGVKCTGCHGFCERGPLVVVDPGNIFYQYVREEDVPEIWRESVVAGRVVERLVYRDEQTGRLCTSSEEIPFYRRQRRMLLAHNGAIDPTKIEEYIAVDGYAGLAKALGTMAPEEVIEEIARSGLRGRGGGGFPTGRKWQFARNASGEPKYVIANADEGDPGAFMNRSLLEGDPHALLEGTAIAGYAIGASEGYVYCRAEYPLALERLRIALEQAEQCGLLGDDILSSGFRFRIKIKEGAGAFVCGEETALIASIEGKRGMPRPRPPFPAVAGLWGKPTIINNVETLACVAQILRNGADWFSQCGTEKSNGTKTFALVGKVKCTGLVEVPLGTTLRELIFDIGGGVLGDRQFKAVQTGGPSGGCIPASLLDTPVDYDSLKAAGSIMGSGGMVVMDDTTCMVDFARYFLDFAQKESCGACVPCRLGTKQMLDILEDITAGRGTEQDIDLLLELAEGVKLGSLCGLGQTAPNPVLTTIRYFRHEYEAHVKQKRCPAVVCKEIISSPCQHVCPIGTQAPVYIALLAQGRFQDAFATIVRDNPLPSVCARVCHHPCESNCQAGKWGSPVAVRALKRAAVDHAVEAGIYPSPEKHQPQGAPVAIVGSGPAGLMAGYLLAKKGYRPTVFEALEVPGGALAVSIPEYRLPRDRLRLDIENIRNAGVEIRTKTRIGKDIPFGDLLADYQAVFIATGAHKSRKLGIPNEDCEGVLDAMEFLKDVSLNHDVKLGRRVGVIGGGNAAVDAARAAARVNRAGEVRILYRRTRIEMPAFPEEIEAAVEEGIELQLLTAPVRLVAETGKLTGLECVKMELGEPDASGRRRPLPVPGSEFVVPLDTVIVAIGEEPHVEFLDRLSRIEVSKGGAIVVSEETLATKARGVFAGGDVVTGPKTVLDAMAAGKLAAEMIDRHLRGRQLQRDYDVTRPSVYVPAVALTDQELEETERPAAACLPLDQRRAGFAEVELGLSDELAVKEARRCLRCDLETRDAKRALAGGRGEGGSDHG